MLNTSTSGLDISKLGEILEDPRKTAIFHSASEDLRVLKSAYGICVSGLFDTSVAETALMPPPKRQQSLAHILREQFNVDVDKSCARSDWRARPLTPEQIQYARLDTRFLVELKRRQIRQLEASGHLSAVLDRCRRLETITPSIPGHNDYRAVFKALRKWCRRRGARESVTEREILNRRTIVALAKARPTSLGQLTRVEGITELQLERFGFAIVQVVTVALGKGADDDHVVIDSQDVDPEMDSRP